MFVCFLKLCFKTMFLDIESDENEPHGLILVVMFVLYFKVTQPGSYLLHQLHSTKPPYPELLCSRDPQPDAGLEFSPQIQAFQVRNITGTYRKSVYKMSKTVMIYICTLLTGSIPLKLFHLFSCYNYNFNCIVLRFFM